MVQTSDLKALCRDCAGNIPAASTRCPVCGSRRLKKHPEIHALSIAHVDLDSFFASVEKRDQPELADKPVIVGGETRGVVAACCYVARMYGVHSAMPMFKALELCPQAVVIHPNIRKYSAVGHQVRELMLELTPLVEPVSIDEAYLDLRGTELLHRMSPARSLAALVNRIEKDIGITASIGLSYNKGLAKLATDIDKPRGFSIIGEAEALSVLGPMSVGAIWGVGPALKKKLDYDGVRTIAELREIDEYTLMQRYGAMGRYLYRFSRGQDDRRIEPNEETKSVSAENTFGRDLADIDALKAELWELCERVSARMKTKGFLGRIVTLKLKTSEFKSFTRSRRLEGSTQLAEDLWQVSLDLLAREVDGRKFRLIGVGFSELTDASADAPPDLFSAGFGASDVRLDGRKDNNPDRQLSSIEANDSQGSLIRSMDELSAAEGDAESDSTGGRAGSQAGSADGRSRLTGTGSNKGDQTQVDDSSAKPFFPGDKRSDQTTRSRYSKEPQRDLFGNVIRKSTADASSRPAPLAASSRLARIERAIDEINIKVGPQAVTKGRGFRPGTTKP